ncbi:MAG TPA: hypothetical protein VIH54_06245, partial [Chthoniobacterales bacterium]
QILPSLDLCRPTITWRPPLLITDYRLTITEEHQSTAFSTLTELFFWDGGGQPPSGPPLTSAAAPIPSAFTLVPRSVPQR